MSDQPPPSHPAKILCPTPDGTTRNAECLLTLNWDQRFSHVMVVTAPPETRIYFWWTDRKWLTESKDLPICVAVPDVVKVAIKWAETINDPNLAMLLDAMTEAGDRQAVYILREVAKRYLDNQAFILEHTKCKAQDNLRTAIDLSERRLLSLSCLISTTLVMAFFSFSFGLLELSGEYRTVYGNFGIAAVLVVTLGIAWIVDWFLIHWWGKKK